MIRIPYTPLGNLFLLNFSLVILSIGRICYHNCLEISDFLLFSVIAARLCEAERFKEAYILMMMINHSEVSSACSL